MTAAAPLHARITPIAAALGDRWAVDGAHLVGPAGERIAVSEDTYHAAAAGRLFLTGLFPDELNGHVRGGRARISVDGARPAASIARDIERRLLPVYRDALTAARARKTESDAVDARRDAVLADVAAALGDGVSTWADKASVGRTYENDAVCAEVEVSTYRERAEFSITVPWALAPEIARLVGQLRAAAAAAPHPT